MEKENWSMRDKAVGRNLGREGRNILGEMVDEKGIRKEVLISKTLESTLSMTSPIESDVLDEGNGRVSR